MNNVHKRRKKVPTWSGVSVCFFSTKGLPARAGTMRPWKTTSTATIAIVSGLPWPARLRDAIGKKDWEWAELKNPNKWWVLCGRGEHLLYLWVSLNPANWFIMTLGRAMYRKMLHRPINMQMEGCDLIDLRRLLFHVTCQTRWDSSQPQMMTWKTRRPLWTSTCSTTHLALFGFISTISIQNANTLSSSQFLLLLMMMICQCEHSRIPWPDVHLFQFFL